MTKAHAALPDEVQNHLTKIALEFAQEIVSILQGSVGELAERLAVPEGAPATPPKKAVGRPRGAAKKSPVVVAKAAKPAKPERGAKPAPKAAPSGDGLDRRVIAQLKKSAGGLGVEQLNRALGTSTVQVGPVLQSLVERGRVTKSGQARGTKYHAA